MRKWVLIIVTVFVVLVMGVLLYMFTIAVSMPRAALTSDFDSVGGGEQRGRECFDDFGYAVQRDWDYALDKRNGRMFTVDLFSDGFSLPTGVDTDGVTVLLEAIVVTEGFDHGSCDMPHVHLRADEKSAFQYFAPRSSGRRYLNVSDVIGNAEYVHMVGQGIGWQTGSARLFVFENPHVDPATRTLVFAAHPDDAEIAAFGLYATTDSDVVTVTAGDSGEKNYSTLFSDDDEHYHVKAMLRVLDSVTVPFIGGVSFDRARNLGYFDGTLATLYERQSELVSPQYVALEQANSFRRLNADSSLANRPFRSQWRGLVDDLLFEIERVDPKIIVTANPLLDFHSDHQYATIALIEALEQDVRGRDRVFLLYTNHPTDGADGFSEYPLGPSTAVESLTPWFGGELPFASIFSYPVDEKIRLLNILALEAMHDLRQFCHRHDGYQKDCSDGGSNYMRRGPRPNEMYLALDYDQMLYLKDLFLRNIVSGRLSE